MKGSDVLMMTTMSKNGQIVIPIELRKALKLEPATQFFVFEEDGGLVLRRVSKKLLDDIRAGEEDIKQGRSLTLDTDMSVKEMDERLRRWKP